MHCILNNFFKFRFIKVFKNGFILIVSNKIIEFVLFLYKIMFLSKKYIKKDIKIVV